MTDRYHIKTSPLICGENQWTGFYMIAASVMKELTHFMPLVHLRSLENLWLFKIGILWYRKRPIAWNGTTVVIVTFLKLPYHLGPSFILERWISVKRPFFHWQLLPSTLFLESFCRILFCEITTFVSYLRVQVFESGETFIDFLCLHFHCTKNKVFHYRFFQ